MTTPESSTVAPVAAPAPPRRTLSLPAAVLRIFDLSLGEMIWSRRTVFMGLVVGVPVVVSVVIRTLSALGAMNMRVNNNLVVDGPTIFGLMIWLFYLRFSVPVLGVFYGTSLMADEVDDKTITYLFSRPIPRSAVLLGKYVAYVVCTVLVVLPSVMVVWFIVVPIRGQLGPNFLDLVKDLGILALGLSAYGALFALVGAVTKKPLLIGLMYVFGWELVTLGVPGYLKHLTIAYYIQGLVPQAMPSADAVVLFQAIFREIPSVSTSFSAIIAIEAVCLFLAARAVSKREYVLEQ